jgi:hypothetical protein
MPHADPEYVALYSAETGLSPMQVAPFVWKGIEPPSRDRVDQIGFSAAEVKMTADYYKTD